MKWTFPRLFGLKPRRKEARRTQRGRLSRLEALSPRTVLAAALPTGQDVADSADVVLSASMDPPMPAAIVNGTRTSDYPSVGIVNNSCSGTLISRRHVLTAAHCTEDIRDTRGVFETGDLTIRTIQLIEHPQFDTFDLINDIAIMVLAEPIDTIAPSGILRERPVRGETLTLVGYGDGGTTFNPVRDFPTKRVGHTPLETITSNQLRWTFDGFGESNTATGDSGGPAFVERNGELLVAGVTSGGDGDPWNSNGDIDHAWETRVDVFAGWIDSIVSGEIPEPELDDHTDEPELGATKIPLVADHGWESGKLQEVGDRDAFRIDLAQPSRVSLTVTSIDGSLDTFLRLYNSDGQLVQSNDDLVSGTNTNSRIIRTLAAGTYFLTVAAFDDEGMGAYSVVVDLGNDPTSDQQVDVTDSGATPWTFDSDGHIAIAGRLETDSDRDVFAFTLGQSTPVVLAALATGGQLDSFLRLYDAQGTLLDFNDDGPVTTDSLLEAELEPGTYYASVASYSGNSSGTYVLSIQATPEPVDWFAAFTKVSLDSYGRSLLEGTVTEAAGFSTYTFTSRFTGNMTAVTRAADATTDTRIMVFDSHKDELIAANDRSLTNLNSIVQFEVVENRRYYVVVQGEAGTTGDYWLTLRTSFSAKEKAFASLSNEPSARKTAKPRDRETIEAFVPSASFTPPQLLPAKAPAGRWRDLTAFSAWRS